MIDVMDSTRRRFRVLVGAIVLGGAIGGGFDAAGVDAQSDSVMTYIGMVGGLGLGILVTALIRD